MTFDQMVERFPVGSRIATTITNRLATVIEHRLNGQKPNMRIRWDGKRTLNPGKQATANPNDFYRVDAPEWKIDDKRWIDKRLKQEKRREQEKKHSIRLKQIVSGLSRARFRCTLCGEPEPLKHHRVDKMILCGKCFNVREQSKKCKAHTRSIDSFPVYVPPSKLG